MKGYSHYEIYEDGTVIRREYTTKRGTNLPRAILQPSKEKNGYISVFLVSDKGESKKFYLHRLLWTAFVGEIKPNMEIDHIDGDRTNFALDNLRELSRKDNANTDKAKERYKLSNARDKGKYDLKRLLNAKTKRYVNMVKNIYSSLLKERGDVKVTELMREAHIGYYRAKRLMNEVKTEKDK